jgi:hypothetical protein
MLLDNSLIHGYLGDGNKIAAISVAKLWTLFSSLLITDGRALPKSDVHNRD